MDWILLILSLPTKSAAVRQRTWRTLKASGAAVLRDGVYVMPGREVCRATLDSVACEVREGGGVAYVLRMENPEDVSFVSLFDRSNDFAALLAEAGPLKQALTVDTVQTVLRQARKLRKSFTALRHIDFFPGEAQQQADGVLSELEQACARTMSPDEPHATEGGIPRLLVSDYQARTWTTRARPWVDRLASAWLIRRFIDPQAHLLWLTNPADCPTDALGFDFDGATFSHVGNRVTFEVLAASFGLEQSALTRLGLVVHCLDVGGIQPPEAAGIECVLAGLRDTVKNDDQLLAIASTVFDGLLATFEKESITA